MRRKINAMPPAATLQLAATDTTNVAKQQAKWQLKEYRMRAQCYLRDWLLAHPRQKGESKEAYMARWENGWTNSREGKEAGSALAPCLATYNMAARRELRLAAKASQQDRAASVQRKAAEIMSRDRDPSWEDQTLDRILTASAARINRELAGVPLDDLA